jgi:hypothetical protein
LWNNLVCTFVISDCHCVVFWFLQLIWLVFWCYIVHAHFT